MSSTHRKSVVKAELAAWHIVADTGPLAAIGRGVRSIHARFLGIAVLVGSVLIGLTTVGVFLTSASDQQPPGGSPVPAVSHIARHKLPHPEHVSKKPVTEPGTHLRKHDRNYVIVRAGDSLWAIAERYLTGMHATNEQVVLAVQKLELRNHLTSASILEVGQRVHL
jgi:LysM domain